jgi:hypothetical protein
LRVALLEFGDDGFGVHAGLDAGVERAERAVAAVDQSWEEDEDEHGDGDDEEDGGGSCEPAGGRFPPPPCGCHEAENGCGEGGREDGIAVVVEHGGGGKVRVSGGCRRMEGAVSR